VTTNYTNTLIEVAADCPATTGEVPPVGAKRTVAALQYELLSTHPYRYTSDEVLFEVHAVRNGIADDARESARAVFLAREQPCLRSSPLGKRYGWGIHHDQDARVALVPVGSPEYDALAEDPSLKHVQAMRSRRA
jgi:hypothetical protein